VTATVLSARADNVAAGNRTLRSLGVHDDLVADDGGRGGVDGEAWGEARGGARVASGVGHDGHDDDGASGAAGGVERARH
jgi:hypothetical protein